MKIKDIKNSLFKVGFSILKKRGKGSHSILWHPIINYTVIVSGKDNNDAKHYQVKALNIALAKTSMNA